MFQLAKSVNFELEKKKTEKWENPVKIIPNNHANM